MWIKKIFYTLILSIESKLFDYVERSTYKVTINIKPKKSKKYEIAVKFKIFNKHNFSKRWSKIELKEIKNLKTYG